MSPDPLAACMIAFLEASLINNLGACVPAQPHSFKLVLSASTRGPVPWQVVGVEAGSPAQHEGIGFVVQVFQVRKKDTGQIYAMKVMRKERILAKDHGDYVRTEREVLTAVFHPYIVTLRCSFQVC